MKSGAVEDALDRAMASAGKSLEKLKAAKVSRNVGEIYAAARDLDEAAHKIQCLVNMIRYRNLKGSAKQV